MDAQPPPKARWGHGFGDWFETLKTLREDDAIPFAESVRSFIGTRFCETEMTTGLQTNPRL